MVDKELDFGYREEPMTGEGKTIKLNEYNKQAYCEKLALKALGGKTVACAKYFY